MIHGLFVVLGSVIVCDKIVIGTDPATIEPVEQE